MNESRGMCNNNSLNIRHGKSRWQGMADYQLDKEFVVFRTLTYGYRAAWVLLDNYRFHLTREPIASAYFLAFHRNLTTDR